MKKPRWAGAAGAPVRVPAWVAALFPVALWLVCTLYLPDRGQYTDDFCYPMRSPVTGEYDPSMGVFDMSPFFMRPLTFIVIRVAPTLLWNHWWAYHVFSAVVHGAVALVLWRLLKALGMAPRAAAIAALLFLSYPAHYEVSLWSTSVVIAIACGVYLATCGLVVRFARRGGGLGLLAGIALLAFLIPCFYEQPGAGLIGLPALYLALAPASQRPVRRVAWAGVLTAVAGATQVLYIVLLASTAPAGARGSTGTLVGSPAQLADRVLAVAESLFRWTLGRRVPEAISGAVQVGLETLASPLGALTLCVLGATGAAWLLRSPAADAPPAPSPEVGGWRRRFWLLLFGLAVTVSAWLPLAMLPDQIAEMRMTYFGLVGPCLLLALVLDALGALAVRPRVAGAFWGAASAAAAVGAVVGAIGCVGWQTNLRLRNRADVGQSRALRELAPDPPAGAYFLAVEDAFRPTRTGKECFDFGLVPWTLPGWLTGPMVQWAYGRTDVSAIAVNPWDPRPLAKLAPDGLSVMRHSVHMSQERAWSERANRLRFSWGEVIPFTIDRAGTVTLVSRVVVERPSGADEVYTPPLVQAAAAPAERRRAYVLENADRPAGARRLRGWRWRERNEPIDAGPLHATKAPRQGFWIHAWNGGPERAMLPLPESEGRLDLLFRVYWPDGGPVHPAELPGRGPAVVWTVRDASGEVTEVARTDAAAAVADGTPRWFPVRVTVSAAAQSEPGGRTLEIHLEPGPAGNPRYDGALVTEGFWLNPPARQKRRDRPADAPAEAAPATP